MIDDNTDRTDVPMRPSIDSSLSDTAMGSGIAQLEPPEDSEDEILDLDPIDDDDVDDDSEILDLGAAEEEEMDSDDSEILDLGTLEEESPKEDTEDEKADDSESGDDNVIDVGTGSEASEDAETAITEPATKQKPAPEPDNDIFSTGDGDNSSAAGNLAMLTGGSAAPKTEDLSVFGETSDKKVEDGDLAKLSEKPKPLTTEMKLRRKNLKLQQSKQSTHTLRKTGIPLLLTMGILLLVVGFWTISIGSNYDPTRQAGNALMDNWGLFAFASLLLGVLLIGAAGFLQYEMMKFNKAAEKFNRKLQQETGEGEDDDGDDSDKSSKNGSAKKTRTANGKQNGNGKQSK